MKPGPKPSSAPRRPAQSPPAPSLAQFERSTRPPIMPDYMSEGEAMEPARVVWMENIERVEANGCHEGDSDLFARYCIQEAGYRVTSLVWLKGTEGQTGAPAAMIESLRKMGELLGLAGPSSRLRSGGSQTRRENSFARNGVQRANRD